MDVHFHSILRLNAFDVAIYMQIRNVNNSAMLACMRSMRAILHTWIGLFRFIWIYEFYIWMNNCLINRRQASIVDELPNKTDSKMVVSEI